MIVLEFLRLNQFGKSFKDSKSISALYPKVKLIELWIKISAELQYSAHSLARLHLVNSLITTHLLPIAQIAKTTARVHCWQLFGGVVHEKIADQLEHSIIAQNLHEAISAIIRFPDNYLLMRAAKRETEIPQKTADYSSREAALRTLKTISERASWNSIQPPAIMHNKL